MSLELLFDENVHVAILHYLEQEGYDAKTVQDEPGKGSGDDEIMDYCRDTRRVLLTNDSDFLNHEKHPGILFIQRQRTPPRKIAASIKTIDRHLEQKDLKNLVLHLPGDWA